MAQFECTTELRRFGEEIRKARKNLKLSQEDFAETCGLHRTYVGQIERGEKNISFVNILRVARALNIPPAVLFTSASQQVKRRSGSPSHETESSKGKIK